MMSGDRSVSLSQCITSLEHVPISFKVFNVNMLRGVQSEVFGLIKHVHYAQNCLYYSVILSLLCLKE